MVLFGFHRTILSDIKLCALEKLQRNGNGLWFGEREGQTAPQSPQRQHLEQKRVFCPHTEYLASRWVLGTHLFL